MPGHEIAQTISLITGVAISPLLGVGAVGAWEYYHAGTAEERARLHWYANPWFWGPALLLVAICFIKDTAGTALPTALKKPFDIADAVENKISGLVATGAFVPLAASIFETPPADGAWLSSMGFAAIDASWTYNIVAIPLAMVAFVLVFLASNAINVLILLSPFTTVDLALKTLRTAVLGSVVATAWINPWVGAVWALILIVAAYFISGWSFRLSHTGLVFIWDFLTLRQRRFRPQAGGARLFLSRKIEKVPARTYGTLSRDAEGRLAFTYRPWLILPERTITLPAGQYEAGRGLFYSEILRVDGNETRTVILLPPRYLGHEEELVKLYGLSGTRDVGFRAAWSWFRNTVKGRATAAPA
ncbi:MAG TPA: hypothetical protein GYA07_00925 [Verrucomicrobia bacterium]|nr:hypothetical protein [Verrucomicrobiota bacterium]HOP96745.1 hypothetical protein [Verrucomicrobiota bacterium]HPU55360.1 hypothetical protein [Verrucomicrobiota bacterium]